MKYRRHGLLVSTVLALSGLATACHGGASASELAASSASSSSAASQVVRHVMEPTPNDPHSLFRPGPPLTGSIPTGTPVSTKSATASATATATVKNVDTTGTCSQGRTSGVQCGTTTTDDSDVTCDVGIGRQVKPFEKTNGGNDFLVHCLTGDIETLAALCADC